MKKQTNKQTTPPSVVPTLTPAPVTTGGFTLGLDLGDRSHYVCVLDAAGQLVNSYTKEQAQSEFVDSLR